MFYKYRIPALIVIECFCRRCRFGIATGTHQYKQMRLKRAIIYPKDVQRITGKSERYGRKLIRDIKDHLKKDEHQFITIDEFSEFTGIDLELINEFID